MRGPTGDPSGPVAEWIAGRKAQGVRCHFNAAASAAVRVAASALEKRLDIAGTVMFTGGEALTDPKRAVIEEAGARPYPQYHSVETGVIGYSCRQMDRGNCVHVMRDSIAVIDYRRKAPLCDTEVNSLLFTTLLPFSSRILVNAEIDDCGVVEPAGCDCVFARAGFTTRIRDIFSFGKLTGLGVTLLAGDLLGILEQRLPERFGGRPGDFQLVESEGARQTSLCLRISPRLRDARAEDVREFFLRAIGDHSGGTPAAWMMKHGDALAVCVGEPLTTRTGKVHALHLMVNQYSNGKIA